MPGGTDFFAGREEVLESLRAQLTPGNGRAAVLCGLGGIGKTQTAVEYVKRNHENYEIVLWCLADSEASLTSGFAAFAPDLGLPEKNDVPELVKDVKRWLERNQNWLLILDNADDPAVAKTFIPPHHKGGVLVTSIADDFSIFGVANPDELDVLTETEAMNFFRARFGRDFSKEESAELANLAEELGHFPLALEQAAAYLRATKTPVTKYLADLKSFGLDILEKGRVTATDYSKTIETTWQAAFEVIESNHPASADVLCVVAFLAPDNIQIEFFEIASRLISKAISNAVISGANIYDLLEPLTQFSLIRIDINLQIFRIHRLAQYALRKRLSDFRQKEILKTLLNIFYDIFPDVETGKSVFCFKLLVHMKTFLFSLLKLEVKNEKTIGLLIKVSRFFRENGDLRQSSEFIEIAIDLSLKLFGEVSQFMAMALYSRSEIHRIKFELKEAERDQVKALDIGKAVFGEGHRVYGAFINNLRLILHLQERLDEALDLYLLGLKISKNNFGELNSNTASSYNNLGGLYHSLNKLEDSEVNYKKGLCISIRCLGKEDPDVAVSHNNLAEIYKETGKIKKSIYHYISSYKILEKFPERKINLITICYNLGNLCILIEMFDKAEYFLSKALQLQVEIFGRGSSMTVNTIISLAESLFAQNKFEILRKLIIDSLKLFPQTLGKTNEKTKIILESLSALQERMKDT